MPKPELVQTAEQTSIPPLSQSRYEDLACGVLYRARHIDRMRNESLDASRGIEIHRILRTYVGHLCAERLNSDSAFFQTLLKGAGADVLEAIEGFDERYRYEPESVYGSEVHITLDGDFNPVPPISDNVVFEGTLDVIVLASETKAIIHDYKSYWRIIDADTFQAKFYPLLLMCLNPSLREVEFILEFIRYGASRSVTYTRDDVPALRKLAIAQRQRQIAMHCSDGKPQASPGRHCSFCPKIADMTCPVADTNPLAQMSPEQRVGFAVFLRQAAKENDRLLKDVMLEGGPITYRDGNGVCYTARFEKQDRKSFPLAKTYQVLDAWGSAHPADSVLFDSLTVGGLSSPLKAKKREQLREALSQVAKVQTITRFSVGRAGEEEEDE